MIDWRDRFIKVAMLQLLRDEEISLGARNKSLAEYLLSLGWLWHTRASNRLKLSPAGLENLQAVAEIHWPEVVHYLRFFRHTGAKINLQNLKRAEKSQHRAPSPLPQHLHWKTYAAIKGEHSKQKEFKNELVAGTMLTSDSILRFRPNRGLIIKSATESQINCEMLAGVLGEGMITERALLTGLSVSGCMPEKVMTIENLGAFVDFPAAENLLLVFQPGWSTDLSINFIALFPPDIPWLHFGDLDPKGLDIYYHLCRRSPVRPVTHFIPEFWEEYLEKYGQKSSDWSNSPPFSNPLLRKLAATGQWLEQEAIVLDKRILENVSR